MPHLGCGADTFGFSVLPSGQAKRRRNTAVLHVWSFVFQGEPLEGRLSYQDN
jgi:hypothetical protein